MCRRSRFLFIYLVLGAQFGWAQTYFAIEGAQTWQTKNDQRIPGQGGDLFSVADFDEGPFLTYRVYVGHKWSERHEIRVLYAPLKIEVDGQFDRSIAYKNSVYAANTPTTITYMFNSYRVTYAYHLAATGDWRWAVGFTGKIRDAEVRLQQGALDESKTNVGFVPLAHVRAAWSFATDWTLDIDFDGLAAPQGRAFDLGLFVKRNWPNSNFFVYGGYRTVEGGADNDEVYNFAWFNSATLGLEYRN